MNATSKDGDIWTGEPPVDGWYIYADAVGTLYESREIPVYRIVMDNATLQTINGKPTICPK